MLVVIVLYKSMKNWVTDCPMNLLNEFPTLCPYHLLFIFLMCFQKLAEYTNIGENTWKRLGQTGAGMMMGAVQTRPLI